MNSRDDRKIKDLELEITQLKAELKLAIAEIDSIVNSTTWRLTSVFRNGVTTLRKIRFLSNLNHRRRIKEKIDLIRRNPFSVPKLLYLVVIRFGTRVKTYPEKSLPRKSHSIEKFWDLAHKKQYLEWIIGSSPINELGYLEVLNELRGTTHKRVLVVGVGDGSTANYLMKRGHDVAVLDITESAFRNLNTGIKQRYLVKDYGNLGNCRFEYILHYRVSKYMQDYDLQKQIEVLVKSLEINGVLKLQFESNLQDDKNDIPINLKAQKEGKARFSNDKILFFVKNLEGIYYEIGNQLTFVQGPHGWVWRTLTIIRKI